MRAKKRRTRDFVVERERTQIVLEGRGASRIDHLDTQSMRCGECPGHIVPDRAAAFALVQQVQEKVIIAEDRQRRLVNDRNIGQFEVCLQSLVRQYGRLNHRREAHCRVSVPGLESIQATCRSRTMTRVESLRKRSLLGQYQATHRFVASGDVGMDVDSARHDDLVGNVIGLVDRATGRRVHNEAVADEKVSNFVATIGRIDNVTAGKTDQHGRATGSFVMILPRTLATEATGTDGGHSRRRASPSPQDTPPRHGRRLVVRRRW